MYEPPIPIGALHVVTVAGADLDIDGYRIGAVDHVMAVAVPLRQGGAVSI
jgi:hypothetical protein